MAKKIVPILLEEEIRAQLYEAMLGDAVLRVMKTIGMEKNSVSDIIERLK
ncbi:MAG: hypothetical protein MJZ32_11915 [Bacteroidaceae bacterium]|nr:hypothetical protein [Bacteroidaceae bacterium]